MANPAREEARLLRKIAYLRTILRHAEDAEIVVALNDFITETETRLVKLRTVRRPDIALH